MNSTVPVALAADSAVTSYPCEKVERRSLLFRNNKIFQLTDSGQVGFLTFGNSQFMGIPIETLVTEYAHKRISVEYETIEQYVDDFLLFLREEIPLHVDSEMQLQQIERAVILVFDRMYIDIEFELRLLGSNRQPPDWDEAARRVIARYLRRVDEAVVAEGVNYSGMRNAEAHLSSRMESLQEMCFGNHLASAHSESLTHIARRSIEVPIDSIAPNVGLEAGLVITGFGSREVFPSCLEIRIESFFEDDIKRRRGQERRIDFEHRSAVLAFGQTDMVDLFMTGIANDLREELMYQTDRVMREYTEELVHELSRYSPEEKEELLNRRRTEVYRRSYYIRKEVEDYGFRKYMAEIYDVVGRLPEEELAEVAEALVDMTSMRRKLSYDEETVGGPTDVATVTKGEGLKWVKRK